MPLFFLLAGVAALYAWFRKPAPLALPAGLAHYGSDVASLFGASQAIAPALNAGQTYLFQVLSPLAAQDLASALAAVGASVVALPVSLGPQEWGGAFTWQGPQGTAVEHLQNVTWLTLIPAPVVSSAQTVTTAQSASTGGSPYVPPGPVVRRPQWDPHGEDDSLRSGFGLAPANRSDSGSCKS